MYDRKPATETVSETMQRMIAEMGPVPAAPVVIKYNDGTPGWLDRPGKTL